MLGFEETGKALAERNDSLDGEFQKHLLKNGLIGNFEVLSDCSKLLAIVQKINSVCSQLIHSGTTFWDF